jgi:hypothetical protein
MLLIAIGAPLPHFLYGYVHYNTSAGQQNEGVGQ